MSSDANTPKSANAEAGHPSGRKQAPGVPAPADLRAKSRQVEVVEFTLNDEPCQVAAPAHWTLLELLRYSLGLTGSKQGCDKGDCGACTVRLNGAPVMSCITLALHAHGNRVDTVEGLGVGGTPHPLQDAFDICGGAQCGFCTPGILMSAAALLERKQEAGEDELTRTEIAVALGGNLCRCTGYTKILDAVEHAWSATKAS